MNTKAIATFNPDLPIHMTFPEHDWHLLSQHWYPIALARDITEQPTATMLLDMPLVMGLRKLSISKSMVTSLYESKK